MTRKTLSLLSLAGRVTRATGHTHNPAKTVRVLAYSSQAASTTSTTTTQSNYASTNSSTRSITTQTKSKGPARPMPQGERDRDSKAYIVESSLGEVPVSKLSAHHYILQDLLKWANKTALECGLTGKSYTYGQIHDGIMKFGGALQRLEAMKGAKEMLIEKGKGPTVAILMTNCPEYPVAFFGGMVAGATVTTVNPAFTPDEVARHFKDSHTKVIVVDDVLEPLANAALSLLGKESKEWATVSVLVNGVSQGGRPNLREIIADSNTPFADVVEPPLGSTATMLYSSGTTGLPKGVCLPHNAITENLESYHNPIFNCTSKAEGESQEVFLGLLPFYHVYGMAVILSSGIVHGAKIVTMPRFDPQAFVSLLTKQKISVLHIVPPLLNFMAASPAITPSILSSMHSIICGAAPILPSVAVALKKKAETPIDFLEGYGLTETMGTHFTPRGGDRLGRYILLQNVKAKVVDVETGEPLQPGQKGEMCINRPALMTSYYNNEKATREAFDDEGFFKTGDVAIYDEEGCFKIVDRLKELIKVKGIQVSPSELEDLLLRHPGVADVGVVGVPNEKSGEAPRAYVVPRSKDVKAEDLQAFVASKLARHKQLAGGVRFVEELPKNQTGKLLRLQLREMAKKE